MIPVLFCSLAVFFVGTHLVTLGIAAVRCRRMDLRGCGENSLPPMTVVRPLCGVEAFSRETLEAAFALDYPCFELIFCVAAAGDPIVPLVREAIAAHPSVAARLLVGDDPISTNPKLNNMVKGWREARHEWIAFIDSNVCVTPDFLRHVVAAWRDDTGAVSAPPVGMRPEGFGSYLECAFLNTHEARWQYVVDTCLGGFAQGKTLFYRKADLDRSAMRELASEPAEDAATTKMVRRSGRRVRLAPPSPLPLGARPWPEVWGRQLRWARLRRATFAVEFLPEILSGAAIPALTLAAAALATGVPAAPALLAYLGVWYAAEVALVAYCRWPLGWPTLPSLLLRDLLLPALWVAALAGRSFTWQGQAMRIEGRRHRPVEPTIRSEGA